MTPFGWMIVAFAVFMTGVCLFAYVQIERNAYQTRQRRLARKHDVQDYPALRRGSRSTANNSIAPLTPSRRALGRAQKRAIGPSVLR